MIKQMGAIGAQFFCCFASGTPRSGAHQRHRPSPPFGEKRFSFRPPDSYVRVLQRKPLIFLKVKTMPQEREQT
jgi:hypothetical protein